MLPPAMAPSAFAEDDEDEEDGFDSAVSSEMTAGWSSSESSVSPERTPRWYSAVTRVVRNGLR